MSGRVLGVKQMRECERAAADYGLDEDILIENAAAAIHKRMSEYIRGLRKNDTIAVFVGGGNNGADGLSLARRLLIDGINVEVVAVSESFNAACEKRLRAFSALGGKVISLARAAARADMYAVAVDAVLGIGLSRDVEGDTKTAVGIMNGCDAKKIAVDVPTGLGADDGRVYGTAVKADVTVALGAYKYGHFLGSGADYCGETVLEQIGIKVECGAVLCAKDTPKPPARKRCSHKGDYGRIKIMGGSPSMIGAPLIAAEAALAYGAGLVTLCVANSLADAYRSRIKEATLALLSDNGGFFTFDKAALDSLFVGADVLVIGPGMGGNPDAAKIIGYACRNFGGTVILDADALNVLAVNPEITKGHRCRLILTPHRGEFVRLYGKTEESEIVAKSQRAAEESNAVVVCKSNTTIITDGIATYINARGTAAQAKGGSGDMLAGIIAAYCACLPAVQACAAACYAAGDTAVRAAAEIGENALKASDCIEYAKRT